MDPEAELYKEDKEGMRCFVDTDSQVLKFGEWYHLPKSDYGKILMQ